MKMLMKDVKLIEKIGRKHRTDHSSLTEPINVLTVQVTTEHMIVQQGSNHTHTPIGNPTNGTGIYKNNSQFQNHSPQQHSQQSAFMVGISTTTLMVNNQLQTGPQQGQQQHPSPQIPQVSQHSNSPIRQNQFNQHFQQPLMPQVSPLTALPQQYNPQILPLYFHQYPPANSPSVDSNESLLARVFHRQMDMAEKQEKCDQEREEKEKHQEEHEK